MSKQFEGTTPPQESKKDLSKKSGELVTITVAEIVQKIKDSPDTQKNIFGKVLNKGEFEEHFPGGGIKAETLKLAASSLGYETLHAEDVQRMLDEHNEK